MSLTEAAVTYAKMGWHIFPLAPQSKMPSISRKVGGKGLHDATNDPDRIERWWTKHPNDNIGMSVGASGLYVVDVDGERGENSLKELISEYGELPDTLCAVTGKGFHYFFKQPADHELGNSASSKLGPGIDTRGHGGYVVLAPSIHPDGSIYEWQNEGNACFDLPQWILDKVLVTVWIGPTYTPSAYSINVHPYVRKVWEGVQRDLASAQQGTRNVELNKAAIKMGHWIASASISRDRVEAELTEIAHQIGLADREIQQTLESGITAGMREPAYPPDPKEYQHENKHQKDARLSEGTIAIQRGSSFGRKEVSYLWGNRVPIGKLTVLAGPAGIGKSYLSLALAANITAGFKMLDDFNPHVDGEVMFCSYEDDVEDTIGPRADRLGVDMDRCHFITGVDTEHGQRQFGPSDVERIIDYLKGSPRLKLIVIDPLGSFMGSGVNVNAENEARAVLQTLVKTASETGTAILIVAHFNKGTESSDPLHRIAGSQGITALPRSVLGVEWGENKERLVRHLKGSGTPEASVVGYRFDGDFKWTRVHRGGDELKEWLRLTLEIAGGSMTVNDVHEKANDYGLTADEVDASRELLNPRIEQVEGTYHTIWHLR